MLPQGASAATANANSNWMVTQLVDMIQRDAAAVENPHRHVVEARNHSNVIGLGKFCDAALCETDVNTEIRILQQPQIVPRAVGNSFFDRDPGSSQDFDITPCVLVEQAIFQS